MAEDEHEFLPGPDTLPMDEYDFNDGFLVHDHDSDPESVHGSQLSSSTRGDKSGGPYADGERGMLWRWHLRRNLESIELKSAWDFAKGLCRQHAKHYALQVERAPTTGSLHVQIRLSLKEKMRWAQVRDLFPGYYACPESNKGEKMGALYCLKTDSRAFESGYGPVTDKDVVHYVYPPYELKNPRPWQTAVMDLLDEQTDRQILIVIDEDGNTGKTTLAHHLAHFHGAIYVPPFFERPDDAMQFLHGQVVAGEKHMLVLDVPRSQLSPAKMKAMMAAFETMKSGFFYDRRYKSQKKYCPPPKLVVFCNAAPDVALLTPDRWQVLRISSPAVREVAAIRTSASKAMLLHTTGCPHRWSSSCLPRQCTCPTDKDTAAKADAALAEC